MDAALAKAIAEQDVAAARAAIASGANVLDLDADGNTPLHRAASVSAEMCQVIYDGGMTIIDARNNAGLSPLHFAAIAGNQSAAEFLLSKGANIDASTLAEAKPALTRIPAGSTPLSIATQIGKLGPATEDHRKLAALFRERGAAAPPNFRKAIFSLPVAVLSIVLLGYGLVHLDARMRGWTTLANKYPATAVPVGNLTNRQDGAVGTFGLIRLKPMLTASVEDNGLFLAMPKWLSAGHEPMLIPWDQIRLTDQRQGIEGPVIQIEVGRPAIGHLFLRGGVAGEVQTRAIGK